MSNLINEGKAIVTRKKGKKQLKHQSPFIFRTFLGDFCSPELISIGPYHWNEEHELDKYKHYFLEKYLSRASNKRGRDLCFYVEQIIALEKQARACYDEYNLSMSSREFVKMMLVDGCFTIELLRHFEESEGKTEDPINNIIMPWQIPILVKDLLLVENQIPFFVLDKLFDLSNSKPEISLTTLALKFFDLAFPRFSDRFIFEFSHFKPNHLLDLLLKTILRPSNPSSISDFIDHTNSANKIELEKSVDELRQQGIEFKPSRSDSLLDVKFKNGVIEIPILTINNLFNTLLVNAMVLEKRSRVYHPNKEKPATDYIYFMSCLIRNAHQVKFLCSKGIISGFSDDDQKVADMFGSLRRFEYSFVDSNSHIGKTIRAIRSYNAKTSARKSTRRLLMETPFVLVSTVCAISLLICTIFQTFSIAGILSSVTEHLLDMCFKFVAVLSPSSEKSIASGRNQLLLLFNLFSIPIVVFILVFFYIYSFWYCFSGDSVD